MNPKISSRYATSLSEIGAELGVTREAVRKIEVRALMKARRWCERRGLALEDLLTVDRDVTGARGRVRR